MGEIAFEYSVVIPTHGRRDLVLQAVESAWAQTVPPADVIVVVDGDTDGTQAALKATWPQTTVIVLEGNTGASGARAVGIGEASTDWVAFLDDDDLWHREKQETIARYVRAHPDTDAVRCGFWLFSSPDEPAEGTFGMEVELSAASRVGLESAAETATPLNDLSYLDIEGRSLQLMLERNRGVVSGTVVKRALLTRIPPLRADLRRGQDWLLFIHIAALAEWHLVPERLVFIRLHAQQITRARRGGAQEMFTAVLAEAWDRYGHPSGLSLADYGPEYRKMIQDWVWVRVRERDLRGAWATYSGARRFLARRADRAYVLTPPPLTWRARRARRWLIARSARGATSAAGDPRPR